MSAQGNITITGTATAGKFNSADQGGESPVIPDIISILDMSTDTPIVNGTFSGAGWGFGVLDGATLGFAGSGASRHLSGVYPTDITVDQSGGNYIYGGLAFEGPETELWITMYAKMPGYTNGMKFIKIFGNYTDEAHGYSNASFFSQTDSVPQGAFEYAGYGDGDPNAIPPQLQNDTSNGIAFQEGTFISTGRAGSLARTTEHGIVFQGSDWGATEHKFQARIKQNSGTSAENETNDGAIEFYIDGILRGRAINIFNKHYLNAPYGSIGIFGYSRAGTEPCELQVRRITVARNGWVD